MPKSLPARNAPASSDALNPACTPIDTADMPDASPELTRRCFLGLVLGAAGALATGCSDMDSPGAGGMGVPVIASATPQPDGSWLVPGGGALKPGAAIVFTLGPADVNVTTPGSPGTAAVLIATPGGSLTALSAICTHAGCVVGWESAGIQGSLHCPCHGSRFDSSGKVLQGPAKMPLTHFQAHRHGKDAIIKTV